MSKQGFNVLFLHQEHAFNFSVAHLRHGDVEYSVHHVLQVHHLSCNVVGQVLPQVPPEVFLEARHLPTVPGALQKIEGSLEVGGHNVRLVALATLGRTNAKEVVERRIWQHSLPKNILLLFTLLTERRKAILYKDLLNLHKVFVRENTAFKLMCHDKTASA